MPFRPKGNHPPPTPQTHTHNPKPPLFSCRRTRRHADSCVCRSDTTLAGAVSSASMFPLGVVSSLTAMFCEQRVVNRICFAVTSSRWAAFTSRCRVHNAACAVVAGNVTAKCKNPTNCWWIVMRNHVVARHQKTKRRWQVHIPRQSISPSSVVEAPLTSFPPRISIYKPVAQDFQRATECTVGLNVWGRGEALRSAGL